MRSSTALEASSYQLAYKETPKQSLIGQLSTILFQKHNFYKWINSPWYLYVEQYMNVSDNGFKFSIFFLRIEAEQRLGSEVNLTRARGGGGGEGGGVCGGASTAVSNPAQFSISQSAQKSQRHSLCVLRFTCALIMVTTTRSRPIGSVT